MLDCYALWHSCVTGFNDPERRFREVFPHLASGHSVSLPATTKHCAPHYSLKNTPPEGIAEQVGTQHYSHTRGFRAQTSEHACVLDCRSMVGSGIRSS